MARWKERASQGRPGLVIDRVEWLWSLQGLEIDLDPGPSLNWYPERWESDAHVQLMSFEIRGMHHHLINIAWKDSRPPGSIASMEDLRLHCRDPEDDAWARIWKILGRAWVERHGKVWQPGTCRSYLGQIAGRLRRARPAAVRHGNPALEIQCGELGSALQADHAAMHAAMVQCNLESAYPYPLPLPTPYPSLNPTELEEPEAPGGATARTVGGENPGGAPDESKPGNTGKEATPAKTPTADETPPAEVSTDKPPAAAGGDSSKKQTIAEEFAEMWVQILGLANSWNLPALKRDKTPCLKHWRTLGKDRPPVDDVLDFLAAGCRSVEWNGTSKGGRSTCPQATTVFSQRRWEAGTDSFTPQNGQDVLGLPAEPSEPATMEPWHVDSVREQIEAGTENAEDWPEYCRPDYRGAEA